MFRWFGVWLDWIVAVYLALVVYSFLVLGGGEKISPFLTKIFLIKYCSCPAPHKLLIFQKKTRLSTKLSLLK